MTKEFAMLQATRRLEGYLSRERYYLNRMVTNTNVSSSLLESKAGQYNELVTTLNELFSGLSGSALPLFERYALHDEEEEDAPVMVELSAYNEEPAESPVEVPRAVLAPAPEKPAFAILFDETQEEPATEPEPEAETEPEVQPQPEPETADAEPEEAWVTEGYPSHAEWLADKETESAERGDDLTISVNVGLAQHRAGQVLTEYSESTEQDINTYMPEDDVPVSVLPQETYGDGSDADDSERATSDLNYLHHTVDNERLDNDPIQIARVETAVEREGASGNRGTDIDVSSYSYDPDSAKVTDLIDDEINKLRVQPTPEYAD